jgi:hypothetical protein
MREFLHFHDNIHLGFLETIVSLATEACRVPATTREMVKKLIAVLKIGLAFPDV